MSDHKPLNEKTLELVARRFRILADPLRLQILQALHGGEMSVGELVEAVGAQQANVSKHLQQLHRAGILDRERRGVQVFYAVGDPTIFKLCDLVCGSIDSRLEEELRALREDG
ncbi:MAG: winged helix-turn-helix transcriptional regulator [Gemmatimonadetes bacterium]|nr:winged helix-turn-helix transcriptional regulator [Gemmatimonadota bacterium]